MRRASLVVLAFALVFTAAATPGAARGYRESTRELAPGITLTSIRDPKGPWRIKILTIDPRSDATIDVALAQDQLPGFETTSSMARRHDAVGAVNGDYATPSGRPVFAFAEDGTLAQTPLMWGRNFAIDRAESRTFFGHPQVSVWATEIDAGATYKVNLLNEGAPFYHQLAEFNRYGGSEERPPRKACNARLFQSEVPRVRDDGAIEALHWVDRVVCHRRIRASSGSVLSAKPDGRYPQIAGLTTGELVALGWSLGWPGVFDAIGGNPVLIDDGQIVWDDVQGESAFFNRHPRTAVAVGYDEKVMLVTVDGRQRRWSRGMRLSRFALFLAERGARWALNLDGGGSTTMYAAGDVVNRPSDGFERGVSSALLVLAGSDRGEEPRSYPPPPSPSPSPAPTATAPAPNPAADPASTGGMLDAARRAGFHLPGTYQRILRLFLRSR